MKELTRRKNEPAYDEVDFIGALGDVIRSATRLQSRLLRIAASGEIVSATRNQKLQRDLLRGVCDLDLMRDLAQFDTALERVVHVRPRSFEKVPHPLLTLEQGMR